jgi:ferric-dicitrate binding protein FerR (iron transport regulator)
MSIEKQPFVKYKLDEEKGNEKRETLTISLNKAERQDLEDDKKILEQPKDSTAIKHLWRIGRIVLHDDKMGMILQEILQNRNRNKRLGIVEFG